jgi:hypothetical protein
MKIADRKKVSYKKKYLTRYDLNSKKINLDNLDGWSISVEMIKWILNNIPFNSVILELGSGKGTIELSKFYNVYTVEHNEEWLYKSNRVKYIYAPLVDNWYDVEVLKQKLPKKYDLLIIDGPIQEKRLNIMNNLNLFDFNGLIIVDDTNRDIDEKISIELSRLYNKKIIKITSNDKEFTILK